MAKKDKKSLDYNYANDQDFSEEIMNNLLEIWNIVRQEREQRETIWQNAYRLWSVDRTESDKAYQGRADLNMPQVRKEIETMSRRIYKGLFPEDYLKADPVTLEDEELAASNTQVLRHYFDNVIKTKSFAMPWIKQGVLYGTSPARSFWRKDVNEQFFKERYYVSNKEGILEPKTKVVQRDVVNYNAPDIRTEDLFQTWIYPNYVDKPDNIKVVFWRTKVQKHELKEKSEMGTCARYDEIKDSGESRDWQWRRSQERLQQFGHSGLLTATQDDNYFDLLEIWCDLILPGSDKPVPCVVEVLDYSYCTRIQRNPYWHQRPPFDFLRFIIPPPGEFYGRGLPEAAESLQHMANDMLNQTMDSATLALNNITIINPAYAPNADSFEIEPAAVWWADPNAVKQFEFPDLSNVGIKNVTLLRQAITELSDNSPQLPDPISGKARSTGQAQLAVNEWQTDLFTFIDLISQEAMSPLAKKVHMLLQQNVTDDEIVRIAGKYAGKWVEKVVEPEDIIGNYNFKWIGALEMENKAVKTQQMLNFLRVYGSMPPETRIQLNLENLFIKILRDGFLIRDVENIVTTDNLSDTVAPRLEHRILDLGGEIKVHATDDDELHIKKHREWMNEQKDPYKRAKMQNHIEKHLEQQQKKTIEAQMMQQQMMLQMGAAQGGQNPGPGNPSQIPETSNQPDIERGMRLES